MLCKSGSVKFVDFQSVDRVHMQVLFEHSELSASLVLEVGLLRVQFSYLKVVDWWV